MGFCLLVVAGCQTGVNQPSLAVGIVPAESPAKLLSQDEQAFQRARVAFGSGDYKTSYRIAAELAGKGFGPVYNLLHFHYVRGLEVTVDRKKAFEMLRKGVVAGDDKAEANLGGWYQRGINVEKDYGKALELLSRSAGKGNAVAKTRLAIMYSRGQGVEKDPQRALSLYRQVYEQTKAEAGRGDL